eukprot:jgi/Chrpa1/23968/Chrysochromulina_OHIO_Genome00009262-RA
MTISMAPSLLMPFTLSPLTASNTIPTLMPFCCASVPSATSVTTVTLWL